MARRIVQQIRNYPAGLIVSRSDLFDVAWYVSSHDDLAHAKPSDALAHYLTHGGREGRDPSPVFDTQYYLRQFPQLDPGVVNPLCHYIVYGEAAGAWPNALFDPEYVAQHLPEASPDRSTLASYMSLGTTRIAPSTRFDPEGYLDAHPLVAAAGINPLWHRLSQPYTARWQVVLPGTGLVCQAQHQLSAICTKNGVTQYHVTGDDPYFVLARRGKRDFEPGHYRFKFGFKGLQELLARAKIYLDYGSGFSETTAVQPAFEASTAGDMQVDLSFDHPVRALRFDPVDGAAGDNLILGFGQMNISPTRRAVYYSRLFEKAAPNPIARAKLIGELTFSALSNRAEASAKLRALRLEQQRPRAPDARCGVQYRKWIEQFDSIMADDRAAMAAMIDDFADRPLISIVMPVYNTPEHLLCACIDSVLDQTYPNWELCIADDKSTKPHVRAVLERYMQRDARIRAVFRPENGHISRASNTALELAYGDWIALLDHDDLLAPHALFCIAETINRKPDVKMIYSDEDKIGLDGKRTEPYFKTDWNERLFFEQNMVCHLGAYRTDLVRAVGGFRAGFEGAQDHDLVLRITEHLAPDEIVHIPHILYHWRVIPGSTALGAGEKSYALIASEKALQEAIERRGIRGRIEADAALSYCRLKLDRPEPAPLVSIIIPTRDGLDILEPCIRSLTEKTDYANYEIIIVDNQSVKPETHAYFDALRIDPRIRVLPYDNVFNYSAINNHAVAAARGSLICLLNNDTEVITGGWLGEMVAELSQDGVGAVGAKLLYTDGTVQHAGVILGVGGHRGVAGHGMLGIAGDAGGYFSHALLSREVSTVTAACLLTRKDIFDEVGGLNETDLRVAFNDIDFCLKVRAAGYKIIWTPHAILHHHESKSRGLENTPEKQARFQGEVYYMLGKWGQSLQHDPYYNPNLALDAETYALSMSPRVCKPWRARIEKHLTRNQPYAEGYEETVSSY